MSLTVTPLPQIGVEIGGVDVAGPLAPALRDELVALWNEHAVLLFRDQHIGPEQQIAFSRLFGELEAHPLKATTSVEYPELFTLVNDPAADSQALLASGWAWFALDE